MTANFHRYESFLFWKKESSKKKRLQSKHCYYSSQQFLKINPLIRNNTDMISFFKTYKVKEYEALENMLNISKEKLKIYIMILQLKMAIIIFYI